MENWEKQFENFIQDLLDKQKEEMKYGLKHMTFEAHKKNGNKQINIIKDIYKQFILPALLKKLDNLKY